jgi:hypothetical protein
MVGAVLWLRNFFLLTRQVSCPSTGTQTNSCSWLQVSSERIKEKPVLVQIHEPIGTPCVWQPQITTIGSTTWDWHWTHTWLPQSQNLHVRVSKTHHPTLNTTWWTSSRTPSQCRCCKQTCIYITCIILWLYDVYYIYILWTIKRTYYIKGPSLQSATSTFSVFFLGAMTWNIYEWWPRQLPCSKSENSEVEWEQYLFKI